jgi:hypothetical protein
MNDHVWVMFTYTLIEVEQLADGTLHTFTTEQSDEIARDEGKLGCFHCSTPLTSESFATECNYIGSPI